MEDGQNRVLVRCDSCRKWFTTKDHPELASVPCPRCGKNVRLRPPEPPGK